MKINIILFLAIIHGTCYTLHLSELVKARAEMDKVIGELNKKPEARKLFDQ